MLQDSTSYSSDAFAIPGAPRYAQRRRPQRRAVRPVRLRRKHPHAQRRGAAASAGTSASDAVPTARRPEPVCEGAEYCT